jgi:hypothetical protein
MIENGDDVAWFDLHRDRQARIRLPHVGESEAEFMSLGPHVLDRRRILVRRTGLKSLPLMRIPFLLFADETVEDRDDILLPIIHEVMTNAAAEYGLPTKRH